MGGSAFSSIDLTLHLHTPRMPSNIYTESRDRLLTILRTFFAQAECPIEAPGKTDHGDIDIMAASPLPDVDVGSETIARAIGAIRHKKTSGSPDDAFCCSVA